MEDMYLSAKRELGERWCDSSPTYSPSDNHNMLITGMTGVGNS
jgi:hypothetical protein